ncbi:Uncharacterised protein [Mycobacterium tuberculosis]|uniref:Uncharacterized protein n=1 Tax=Mycobacterium tuberculosis TaxID=1773 RepID=A0A655IN85_MYCTX|nr:Uncharacterised protein [Mycobacterium tuberculosis]CNU16929.1 Uncharacterised protein [Mycobacterium tuberculosis]CNV13265.1 Uncharacterised protein [Mycobacterium tuberculosis]CNV40786.1 Uncharacterised protein [Mycobacterium tuberculosis]CNW01524.1 Uncharacterised protein [Mycobacterium tuberculosis]
MVAGIECPVAFRPHVVNLGERDRNGQVVVERFGEPWGRIAGADGAHPGANAVQEVL